MNAQSIFALVGKDLTLYFKNRFFAFVTILALVFYIIIYLFMPSDVDEDLELAIFSTGSIQLFIDELIEEGLDIHEFESEQAMKDAIIAGDHNVGVTLPDDYAASLAAGREAEISIYFASDFPEEFKDFYTLFFEEVSFNIAGKALNLDVTEEVLGPDLVGDQIATRDRMLPLFAVFVLMMETLGLASLITTEVEGRTIQALLVTPLTTTSLFVSKSIMGTGLAFVQAAILMLATGGFNQEPMIVVTALLLGSLLATGVAFLIASVARDFMTVLPWGMLAIVVLSIPTFNVLLPGLITGWVQIIPSYFLVDAVHRVVNFGASWADVSRSLLLLFLFSAAFYIAGMAALRRKFQ